jgi:hypothetical protein
LLRLAVSKSSSKCIAETGSVKIQQQMYCWDWQCQNPAANVLLRLAVSKSSSKFETGSVKISEVNLLLRLAVSKFQQQIYCWDWQCQNSRSKLIAETGSVKFQQQIYCQCHQLSTMPNNISSPIPDIEHLVKNRF